MTDWTEEFANILAQKLGENLQPYHKDIAECWYSEIDWDDPISPEDAVDEELSCWG